MTPEPNALSPAIWWLTISSLRTLFRLSARPRVKFYHPLPEGGYILATNHVSHFDPPLISSNFPRAIDWIATKELLHGPVLTRFFQAVNVIPVDRSGADRTALRTATKRLQAGRVIGIFPEGGIRDGAASVVNGAPMKGGVAVLATLSGAPIVPGLILGSERLYNRRNWQPWRRAPVWIGYGAPIHAPAGLTGEARRNAIETALAAAFLDLRDRLVRDYALGPEDLPHSPQQRMREP